MGFSIVELAVTVAIIGLTLAIGLPSMNDTMHSRRIDTSISKLSKDLIYSRSYAITNQRVVTICPMKSDVCSNDWSIGYTAFLDINGDAVFNANDKKLQVNDEFSYGEFMFSSTPSTNVLQYRANGQITTQGLFVYCPAVHKSLVRGIKINAMGRSKPTKDYDEDGIDDEPELVSLCPQL